MARLSASLSAFLCLSLCLRDESLARGLGLEGNISRIRVFYEHDRGGDMNGEMNDGTSMRAMVAFISVYKYITVLIYCDHIHNHNGASVWGCAWQLGVDKKVLVNSRQHVKVDT